MLTPAYDLRPCSLAEIASLCVQYHGYGSASASATYAYAVYENGLAIAGYAWQPPPPGAAKNICPEEPAGVLALSRMVAVPREARKLRHVSTPLRRQLKLIDRTRWPVLVTYSDEGQGHTGHVYKCSGWRKTSRSLTPVYETVTGTRASPYSNGKRGGRNLRQVGHTWIQRWEHWICEPGQAANYMASHGWVRRPIPGKRWRSGNQAYTWIRTILPILTDPSVTICRTTSQPAIAVVHS
jgi:hypothetical protein